MNFHQILTWNYDFDLYKEFSMKKMTKFIRFLQKNTNCLIFMISSKIVKNIKGFYFFSYFHIYNVPNYFLDNCHYEKIFFKKQLGAILHQFAREKNYSSPTYIVVPLTSPTYFCILPTQLHK